MASGRRLSFAEPPEDALRRRFPRLISSSGLEFMPFRSKIPHSVSMDSVKESLERHGRRSLRAADEKAHELLRTAKRRYLAHELLLLSYYQRHSPRARWVDPLARWRAAWRLFGTLALILNCLFYTCAAWVTWRCEIDRFCDLARRPCPRWAGTAPVRELLLPVLGQVQRGERPTLPAAWAQMPGPGHGCRRELGALLSGMSVQAFSLAELGLGIQTAALYGRAGPAGSGAASSHSKGALRGGLLQGGLHYGTSAGRLALALVSLDVALAVPWTLAFDALILVPWKSAAAEAPHEAAAALGEGVHPWMRPIRRWLRTHRWFRTIVGWRRLSALPPASYPLQWAIDNLVAPSWFGVGKEATGNFIRALPTIGDALLEVLLYYNIL